MDGSEIYFYNADINEKLLLFEPGFTTNPTMDRTYAAECRPER